LRIIIDTELQAVIVPESYYGHVDKLNEIIAEAGGRPFEYDAYIRTCFEKAYNSRIMSQTELTELRGGRRKKKAAADGSGKRKDGL